MKWWVSLILVVICWLYVIIGGAIFHALESDNEDNVVSNLAARKAQFLARFTCMSETDLEDFVRNIIDAYDQGVLVSINSSSESNWDVASSIYFATTVVTTIGYGNISPSTSGGRSFCIVYALIGIPLCLTAVADLGVRLNKIYSKIHQLLDDHVCKKSQKTVKIIRKICIQLAFFCIFVLIPAAIFQALENDWSYGIGIYYSIVSLTTIGFGDYVAGANYTGRGREIYRLLVGVWIWVGLAWMASIIASFQEDFSALFGKLSETKISVKKDDGSETGKARGSSSDLDKNKTTNLDV